MVGSLVTLANKLQAFKKGKDPSPPLLRSSRSFSELSRYTNTVGEEDEDDCKEIDGEDELPIVVVQPPSRLKLSSSASEDKVDINRFCPKSQPKEQSQLRTTRGRRNTAVSSAEVPEKAYSTSFELPPTEYP